MYIIARKLKENQKKKRGGKKEFSERERDPGSLAFKTSP